MMSIKHNIKALNNANLFNGTYIFFNKSNEPRPKFFAVSNKEIGILSMLDLSGDLPTAINLIKRAQNNKKYVPVKE